MYRRPSAVRAVELTMDMKVAVMLVTVVAGFLLLTSGCSSVERKLLFYPTHRPPDGALPQWKDRGEVIGCSREVASPRNVWLMLHGNGGQAADRAYAIGSFSAEDSVYILEYPGYGERGGTPSKRAFNEAAKAAYLSLKQRYPAIPVCVAAESIGSGPACSLAALPTPPEKLVLIVPFDRLSLVAREHYPSIVVGLLLKGDWDNVQALVNYKGPVEIFAAKEDTIIPPRRAQALAAAVSSSKLTLIDGGHNDWSRQPQVKIRNP